MKGIILFLSCRCKAKITFKGTNPSNIILAYLFAVLVKEVTKERVNFFMMIHSYSPTRLVLPIIPRVRTRSNLGGTRRRPLCVSGYDRSLIHSLNLFMKELRNQAPQILNVDQFEVKWKIPTTCSRSNLETKKK